MQYQSESAVHAIVVLYPIRTQPAIAWRCSFARMNGPSDARSARPWCILYAI